jgi:hypothetical protein
MFQILIGNGTWSLGSWEIFSYAISKNVHAREDEVGGMRAHAQKLVVL